MTDFNLLPPQKKHAISRLTLQSAYTRTPSLITPYNKLYKRLEDKTFEEGGLPLEDFFQLLNLENFHLLTEEEKQDTLEVVDPLELFNAVQEVNQELALVKLENHFLIDFLQQNDPKLLIGLQQKRAQATTQAQPRRYTNVSMFSMGSTKTSLSKRSFAAMSKRDGASVYSVAASQKKNTDYHLNYRTKVEMAEKTSADVEKQIHDIEGKANTEIKLLGAQMEELRFSTEETDETAHNFELHFLRDARDIKFLETATEKQLERKLKKFVNNWIKNARAMLGTMRLRITAIQENCQQQRNDLITKADLSGILGAVDFEQLIIKRGLLFNSLDEKNAHMAGLKGVTGKASLSMSEEKQLMINTENESKRITNKTVEVIKVISKLEKEAHVVEIDNNRDMKILWHLKEQLRHFEAPSVNQYVEVKEDISILEKEEKMLERKVFISTMKLNNALKRCKKREDERKNIYE